MICFLTILFAVLPVTTVAIPWYSPVLANCFALRHELERLNQPTANEVFVLHLETPSKGEEGNAQHWESSLRLWFNRHALIFPAYGIRSYIVEDVEDCSPGGFKRSNTFLALYDKSLTRVERFWDPNSYEKRLETHRQLYDYFLRTPPSDRLGTTRTTQGGGPKVENDGLPIHPLVPLDLHLSLSNAINNNRKGHTHWKVGVFPNDENTQNDILRFRELVLLNPQENTLAVYTAHQIDLDFIGPFLVRVGHIEPHMGWYQGPVIYDIQLKPVETVTMIPFPRPRGSSGAEAAAAPVR